MRKFFAILFVSIALVGCGSSNNGFVATPLTNSGNPILPQAVNDTYTTLGNAPVSFPSSSGVLRNDVLPSGGIDTFDAATTQNGSVSLNSDGSFTYTPRFGFTGTDTFTYTLANGAGTSTATVTIQVPEAAYFVNNSGSNGNGSLATPFNNISSAMAAANENDVIFLFRGDGTSTGMDTAVTLKNGQSLVGEATGLTSDGTIVAPGQRPNTSLQLTLADNNKISGLAFSRAGTGDIITGDTFTGLTAQDNLFNTESSRAVNLEDASGSISITKNRFVALAGGADGVRIYQAAGSLNANVTIESNRFQTSNTPILGLVANPGTAGDLGVDLQLAGGTTTVTLSENVMEQVSGNSQWQTFLNLLTENAAQGTVTLNKNLLSAVNNDAVVVNVGGTSTLRLEASNNSGSSIGSDAFRLLQNDASKMTCILTGNNFSVQDQGINQTSSSSLETAIRLVNNIFSSAGTSSANLESGSSGTVCLDATGNTLDKGLRLVQTDTATFQVEQFNSLSTLNNGANIITSGTITNVADGTCQF